MFEMLDNSTRQAADQVCFEQPLSERMRTFLRLEFLFGQAEFHSDNHSPFSSRATIASLLEMLVILNRGDIRSELLKELEYQMDRMVQYRQSPGVDSMRLDELIGELNSRRNQLTSIGINYLQTLKDSDFLSAIKHRSAIPGGTCSFDMPDFAFWLSLPAVTRQEQVGAWLRVIAPLHAGIGEVLWLAREGTEPTQQTAQNGFFQHSLNHNAKLSLIRVSLDKALGLFPEISAGRHRVTIRFVRWEGTNQRPKQADEAVDFSLALS